MRWGRCGSVPLTGARGLCEGLSLLNFAAVDWRLFWGTISAYVWNQASESCQSISQFSDCRRIGGLRIRQSDE